MTDWTPEDIETLTMLYGTMPNKELASRLDRTKQSIQWKAFMLRITTLKVATRKHCVDCGVTLSRAACYTDDRERPSSRCRVCADANHAGENHHNWKGGIAPLRSLVHVSLKPAWIDPIMKRDGYTCQVCQKHGGDLHVHHTIPYCTIRDMVIKENPGISQATFEGKKALVAKIVAYHKMLFGITLCVPCHKMLHSETRGELLETPNASGEDNQQPIQSNVRNIVDWQVQRLTLEDARSNKSDTSAPLTDTLRCDDIVCSCM